MWRKLYLQSIQLRNKWRHEKSNIEVGYLVLIKSNNMAQTQRPLARVTELHPGAVSLVKTVTIKTSNSQFLRQIVKLILLLSEESNFSSSSRLKLYSCISRTLSSREIDGGQARYLTINSTYYVNYFRAKTGVFHRSLANWRQSGDTRYMISIVVLLSSTSFFKLLNCLI